MPTAGAIRAGRAFVEIFADDSKLQRGLSAAQTKLKAFAYSAAAIGGAMVGAAGAVLTPILAATKTFMSTGDALDEMSSRVGVSVEFLSALSHAASLSGTSIEALEVGVRKLQKTAYDAAGGSKTAEEAFAALGISVTDANGNLKGTEALFMETTTALGNVANETAKGRAGRGTLRPVGDVAVTDAGRRRRRHAGHDGGGTSARPGNEHRGCQGGGRTGRRLAEGHLLPESRHPPNRRGDGPGADGTGRRCREGHQARD